MKYVLGFFRVVFSFVFMIILTLSLSIFGVIEPISTNLSLDNLSSTIEATVDTVIDGVLSSEEFEQNIGTELEGMLKESGLGISSSQITSLLKQEEVKNAVTDLIKSSVMNSMDGTTEIIYPSQETITDIAYNNVDLIKELAGGDLPGDFSKAQIEEFVNSEYPTIKGMLEELASSLGEIVNGSN